jgi:SM-20-related protein
MRYFRLQGFLGPDLNAELLEHVRMNETAFQPSRIGHSESGEYRPMTRMSMQFGDLGRFGREFKLRLTALHAEILEHLQLSRFWPSGFEAELVAHGNGAHYRPHVDTSMGPQRDRDADRLISAVYYFYREPRRFSGGALRLHSLPGIAGCDGGGAIDVSAAQDCLVAFPSWMPHEVLEVSCPSGKFLDSRFAANCWVLRARQDAC